MLTTHLTYKGCASVSSWSVRVFTVYADVYCVLMCTVWARVLSAANELSAAKLDAQQLAETLDGTLGELEAVCSELCGLANQPHLWLLCAADNNSYKVMDDHINEQHLRWGAGRISTSNSRCSSRSRAGNVPLVSTVSFGQL